MSEETKTTKVMSYIAYAVIGLVMIIGIGAGLASMGSSSSNNAVQPAQEQMF